MKDFVRDRILTLPVMVMFFLRLPGGAALQSALDEFFRQMGGDVDFLRKVTKSALCQARQKFKASAFVELNRLWVRGWHEAHTGYEHWCGLRAVAVDGVCFRLPKWRENIDTFGSSPNKDGKVIMTCCLELFSTETQQFLHFEIGDYSQGERALLVKSLDQLEGHDFLMDRGHPSWWLFALLQIKERAFCARIDNCSWPLFKQSIVSGNKDWLTPVRILSAKSKATLRTLGFSVPPEEVRLRFILVVLSNGRNTVLVNGLVDQSTYLVEKFAHRRPACWTYGFVVSMCHLLWFVHSAIPACVGTQRVADTRTEQSAKPCRLARTRGCDDIYLRCLSRLDTVVEFHLGILCKTQPTAEP